MTGTAARLNALADAYVAGWSRQHLDEAVYLGAPADRHDMLPDNSLAGIRAWQAREDAWLTELAEVDAAALDDAGRVTYGLLREALEASVGWRVARPELWRVDQRAAGTSLIRPSRRRSPWARMAGARRRWPGGAAFPRSSATRRIAWRRASAPAGLPPATPSAAFDIRRFHTAVLEDGSVTLPMLREKIGRWMGRQLRG